MTNSLDRKVGYWLVVAIPTTMFYLGFLLFNLIEWLYPIPVILIIYFFHSLHRCTECNKHIFSWDRRCGKCGDPAQYYKVEACIHDI